MDLEQEEHLNGFNSDDDDDDYDDEHQSVELKSLKIASCVAHPLGCCLTFWLVIASMVGFGFYVYTNPVCLAFNFTDFKVIGSSISSAVYQKALSSEFSYSSLPKADDNRRRMLLLDEFEEEKARRLQTEVSGLTIWSSSDFYYRAISSMYLSVFYFSKKTNNILTTRLLEICHEIELDYIKSYNGYKQHSLIYKETSDEVKSVVGFSPLYLEAAPGSFLNYIYPDILQGHYLFNGNGETLTLINDDIEETIRTYQDFGDLTEFFDFSFNFINVSSKYLASVYPFGYSNSSETREELMAFVASFKANVIDKLPKSITDEVGIAVTDSKGVILEEELYFYLGEDLTLAIWSLIVIYVVVYLYCRSIYITTLGLVGVASAFIPCFAIYYMVWGESFNLVNMVSLWVILGIGCDDICVFMSSYRRSPLETVDGSIIPHHLRLAYAYREAGAAMFVTSFTTSCSFLSLCLSTINPLPQFGWFLGSLVLANFVIVMTWFPCILQSYVWWVMCTMKCHCFVKRCNKWLAVPVPLPSRYNLNKQKSLSHQASVKVLKRSSLKEGGLSPPSGARGHSPKYGHNSSQMFAGALNDDDESVDAAYSNIDAAVAAPSKLVKSLSRRLDKQRKGSEFEAEHAQFGACTNLYFIIMQKGLGVILLITVFIVTIIFTYTATLITLPEESTRLLPDETNWGAVNIAVSQMDIDTDQYSGYSTSSGESTGAVAVVKTLSPTKSPTAPTTQSPSKQPTDSTNAPTTKTPTTTAMPTITPSSVPTSSPLTLPPTDAPSSAAPTTVSPTVAPTKGPTNIPTKTPIDTPTIPPTISPTTQPSIPPTQSPSKQPTDSTNAPTQPPSIPPTTQPSTTPTLRPSEAPSKPADPTKDPTIVTDSPTNVPSSTPTSAPSGDPSAHPSAAPSQQPTEPTQIPTKNPSVAPSSQPSIAPSKTPSAAPSDTPSKQPSFAPSTPEPTSAPSKTPTTQPTLNPSQAPSITPTIATENPSIPPTNFPTRAPTYAAPVDSSFLCLNEDTVYEEVATGGTLRCKIGTQSDGGAFQSTLLDEDDETTKMHSSQIAFVFEGGGVQRNVNDSKQSILGCYDNSSYYDPMNPEYISPGEHDVRWCFHEDALDVTSDAVQALEIQITAPFVMPDPGWIRVSCWLYYNYSWTQIRNEEGNFWYNYSMVFEIQSGAQTLSVDESISIYLLFGTKSVTEFTTDCEGEVTSGKLTFNHKFDIYSYQTQQRWLDLCDALDTIQDEIMYRKDDDQELCFSRSFNEYLNRSSIDKSMPWYTSRPNTTLFNDYIASFVTSKNSNGFSSTSYDPRTFKSWFGTKNNAMWFAQNASIAWVFQLVQTQISRKWGGAAMFEYYQKWDDFISDFNADSPKSFRGIQTSNNYIRMEVEVAFLDGFIQSVAITILLCAIVMVFFTQNLYLTLLVCFYILIICIWVVGLFGALGWPFGLIEIISVPTVVGLTIDYALHITHAYIHSPFPDRLQRTKSAINDLGSSVFASAMTTISSMCILYFATIVIFSDLGWVVGSTTSFGVVLALFVCPPCLMYSGPEYDQCHFSYCCPPHINGIKCGNHSFCSNEWHGKKKMTKEERRKRQNQKQKRRQKMKQIELEDVEGTNATAQNETNDDEYEYNDYDDLPQGWNAVLTDDGKVYYQNDITRESQWKRPEIAPSAPAAEAEAAPPDYEKDEKVVQPAFTPVVQQAARDDSVDDIMAKPLVTTDGLQKNEQEKDDNSDSDNDDAELYNKILQERDNIQQQHESAQIADTEHKDNDDNDDDADSNNNDDDNPLTAGENNNEKEKDADTNHALLEEAWVLPETQEDDKDDNNNDNNVNDAEMEIELEISVSLSYDPEERN